MIAPTGGYANRMHIGPLLHGAVVDGASKMHHRAFEVYLDRLIDVADAKPNQAWSAHTTFTKNLTNVERSAWLVGDAMPCSRTKDCWLWIISVQLDFQSMHA